MNVSPKTMGRWLKGNTMPRPENIRKVNTLGDLQYLCGNVFRTQETVRRWMRQRLPMLDGLTPMFYFLAGDLEKPISVLANIESGAFI